VKENVVHITVGCLFDLYVKDLISKETYDECIRAYKEYQQSKGDIPITSDSGISFDSGDDHKGIVSKHPNNDNIMLLKEREGLIVYGDHR